jgi:ribosome-interacting GTPase 1
LQLLYLPGIIEGAKDGKGKKRHVIGMARTFDLILVVLDAVQHLIYKGLFPDQNAITLL